ncbi:AAA family ATPase [Hymenobacter sp. BT175]|uniref:McrB family protein n=1 Tax=Hymenobacter translucens TaxID=2886507 RepID=UPI001D0E2C0B|nr:AAA family ATPase [Hymenobacter translucens]MCC2548536.1 AAA family ATPase [Hymenobacter translucens]
MPQDVIPYNYPDKLAETWADWSDEHLAEQPEPQFRVRTGFQDIAGSSGSSDRSRALEIYNVGFLRGPLVPPQSGGRNTPLGWQLVSDGIHAHTSLGYLGYLLGEAYKSNQSPPIAAGLSALSALIAVQSHIILASGVRISYVSLFEWLKNIFPRPLSIPTVTWLRYLSTGMFCTIKQDALGEELAASFLLNRPASDVKLHFIWDTESREVDYAAFCQLLQDEPSLVTIKPRKHSLFWIGSPSDQRGLYSQAARNCGDFLSSFAAEETRLLRLSGHHRNEPFERFLTKDASQETQDIISITKRLSEIPSLARPVQKLMKTLREGSLEAVRQLYGEDAVVEASPPPRPPSLPTDLPYQKILFGPPGTGKSHEAEKVTKGYSVKRTTFHPDADYASFVGSYKPVSKTGTISYEFRPQVFAEAYLAAWKNPAKAQFLLIEEINRGNCAQIFGDLFQSLDRNEHGSSRYEARADADFATWFNTELATDADALAAYEQEMKERGLSGVDWIVLPANLYIWATMNTSDQSLYPMDSAFKRRWDWQYIPINLEDANDVTIDLGGAGKYNWGKFIEEVNKRIYQLLESEDKQLGNRFVDPKTIPRVITTSDFKSKVLFYLWSEIYKLETESGKSIFLYRPEGDGSESIPFTFADLYKPGADERILRSFMKGLDLEPSDEESGGLATTESSTAAGSPEEATVSPESSATPA